MKLYGGLEFAKALAAVSSIDLLLLGVNEKGSC